MMNTVHDVMDSDSEYELASESINHEEMDDIISKSIGADPISAASSSEYNQNVEGKKETDIIEDDEVMEEYSEEELVSIKTNSLQLKEKGNERYKDGDHAGAVELYTKAIVLCRKQLDETRSILHANRAACYMVTSEYKNAENDCSVAIELNSTYLKAIIRRAQAREKLEKLSPALEDYKKALELNPYHGVANEAVRRLPKEIEVQQEKMKEECISKLKDLGNLVLKPFGLSTDNFNMVQDPNSGGYNIQFSQNKQN